MTVGFFGYAYIAEQRPSEILGDIRQQGRFMLYGYDLIDRLSNEEVALLYRNSCTRKCHSRDVVENKPRTAPEWDWIVTRMKAPDRADIPERHALAITRYLQERFLSNVPTVLPEETMRFIKRNLWKSDFGEDDLYFDLIYVPSQHLSLLPYLVATKTVPPNVGAMFIIYINTHQGAIPPWKLAELTTLRLGDGRSSAAIDWKVLYEDGQHHHTQGILTFPPIDEGKARMLEVGIKLPGMREKVFQWQLPIPHFAGDRDVERQPL